MKRTYKVHMHEKQVEREYDYIPFRCIITVLITAFEVLAVRTGG